MNFIKKNKFTIITIVVLILVVIIGVEIKNLLGPDEGKASYGDRLDGIENYPLTDTLFTSIEETLKENTKVLNVENQVHGKIINLLITVSDDVSVSDAKQIASSTVSLFENDELSYYSLQVYVLKEDESLNNFPIIGYKGTQTDELVFTKDREITSEEDTNEEQE